MIFVWGVCRKVRDDKAIIVFYMPKDQEGASPWALMLARARVCACVWVWLCVLRNGRSRRVNTVLSSVVINDNSRTMIDYTLLLESSVVSRTGGAERNERKRTPCATALRRFRLSLSTRLTRAQAPTAIISPELPIHYCIKYNTYIYAYTLMARRVLVLGRVRKKKGRGKLAAHTLYVTHTHTHITHVTCPLLFVASDRSVGRWIRREKYRQTSNETNKKQIFHRTNHDIFIQKRFYVNESILFYYFIII